MSQDSACQHASSFCTAPLNATGVPVRPLTKQAHALIQIESFGVPDAPQAASAEAGPASEAGRRVPEVAQGNHSELSADLWAHEPLETVDAGQFYRMLGRTGISYRPAFRMVERVATSDAEAMLRCA